MNKVWCRPEPLNQLKKIRLEGFNIINIVVLLYNTKYICYDMRHGIRCGI
jgi:hypothetical protein